MKKLLFVYNVDWSLGGLLREVHQKITDPNNPECQLCNVTYSGVIKKKDWKTFLGSIPYEVQFMYRNEFIKKFPYHNALDKLPLVGWYDTDTQDVCVILDHHAFKKIEKVSDLISLLEQSGATNQ